MLRPFPIHVDPGAGNAGLFFFANPGFGIKAPGDKNPKHGIFARAFIPGDHILAGLPEGLNPGYGKFQSFSVGDQSL